MRTLPLFLAILFSATSALAASWETRVMRTPGGGLIRIGTSVEDVRKELGSPLHQRTSREAGQKRGGRGENWTYRGNDGYYTLQIQGGRVTRINVRADRD